MLRKAKSNWNGVTEIKYVGKKNELSWVKAIRRKHFALYDITVGNYNEVRLFNGKIVKKNVEFDDKWYEGILSSGVQLIL